MSRAFSMLPEPVITLTLRCERDTHRRVAWIWDVRKEFPDGAEVTIGGGRTFDGLWNALRQGATMARHRSDW